MFQNDFGLDNITPDVAAQDNDVHVHVKQRGRKQITYVTGIPSTYNLVSISKEMKKRFSCGGSAKKIEEKDVEETGTSIILSGDQRENIKEYLIKNSIMSEDKIHVHGF